MATAAAPHRSTAASPAPVQEADLRAPETAPVVVDRPETTRAEAARERECRDAECLALFLALVTAALVTSGLTLATDVVGIPRVLLGFGSAALVSAVTIVLASPPRRG